MTIKYKDSCCCYCCQAVQYEDALINNTDDELNNHTIICLLPQVHCPGWFYTETVISYISIIDFLCFGSFVIMRFLSALLPSLSNKSVTLKFHFFHSFIYVICLLWGPVGRHHFVILGPTISKILFYLVLCSIEKLSLLLYKVSQKKSPLWYNTTLLHRIFEIN